MLHEDCALLRRPGLREDRHHRGLRDLPRDPARGPELQGPDAGRQLQRRGGPAAPGRGAPGAAPPDGPLQQDHPGQPADRTTTASSTTSTGAARMARTTRWPPPPPPSAHRRAWACRWSAASRWRASGNASATGATAVDGTAVGAIVTGTGVGDKDRDKDRDRGDRERRESGGGSQAAPAAPPSAGADKAPGA